MAASSAVPFVDYPGSPRLSHALPDVMRSHVAGGGNVLVVVDSSRPDTWTAAAEALEQAVQCVFLYSPSSSSSRDDDGDGEREKVYVLCNKSDRGVMSKGTGRIRNAMCKEMQRIRETERVVLRGTDDDDGDDGHEQGKGKGKGDGRRERHWWDGIGADDVVAVEHMPCGVGFGRGSGKERGGEDWGGLVEFLTERGGEMRN